MKKIVMLLSVSLLVYSPCFSQNEAESVLYKNQENDHYEMLIPEGNQTSVLILFPGFPETPEVVKREFKIVEPAMEA